MGSTNTETDIFTKKKEQHKLRTQILFTEDKSDILFYSFFNMWCFLKSKKKKKPSFTICPQQRLLPVNHSTLPVCFPNNKRNIQTHQKYLVTYFFCNYKRLTLLWFTWWDLQEVMISRVLALQWLKKKFNDFNIFFLISQKKGRNT